MDTVLIGLLLILVGAAFCFAGYRLFRLLLPVWGFVVGFLLGASTVSQLLHEGFLATPLGWIVGIIVGLILAILSYIIWSLQIIILGALVGYLLGVNLMSALNVAPGSLTFLAGILGAILVAVLVIALNLPKIIIIVLSAFGGAQLLVGGVLLLLGQIKLPAFNTGAIGAIIGDSVWWWLIWLVLAIVGIITQIRTTAGYAISTTRTTSV
jgi:Domain of unknown function (DUF4203)